jgi:hypothetical protein
VSVKSEEPVPESGNDCSKLPDELSQRSIPPLITPDRNGVNVTFMVQLAPGASEVDDAVGLGQSSVSLYVPSPEMLAIKSGALPEFVSVTACGGLVAPTSTLSKVRLEGENVTWPLCAFSDRKRYWGLPCALSFAVISPDSEPHAVVVVLTVIVQLPLGGIVEGARGQLSVSDRSLDVST